MLQRFAETAKKLDPSMAKKAIEICLDHPETPPDQKERLKSDLKDLEGGIEAPPEF
jgi:hypothetical protein